MFLVVLEGGFLLVVVFFNNVIYLLSAMLGLCCCAGISFVAAAGGHSPLAVQRLLLWSTSSSRAGRLQWLQHVDCVVVPRLSSTGSVVGVHGLSCSAARGIFPDQGSDPLSCTDRQILYH